MKAKELRERMSKIGAFCITASFFEKRWQYAIHFDSRALPFVEGLPCPDMNEALRHALAAAEAARRNH